MKKIILAILYVLFVSITIRAAYSQQSNQVVLDVKIGDRAGEAGLSIPVEGEIGGPSSFCVDGEENIYILDRENDRIQKFNSNGKLEKVIRITGDYQIYTDIDVDDEGNIYITVEKGFNETIVKFNSEGGIEDTVNLGEEIGSYYPHNITVNKDGIYFWNPGLGYVFINKATKKIEGRYYGSHTSMMSIYKSGIYGKAMQRGLVAIEKIEPVKNVTDSVKIKNMASKIIGGKYLPKIKVKKVTLFKSSWPAGGLIGDDLKGNLYLWGDIDKWTVYKISPEGKIKGSVAPNLDIPCGHYYEEGHRFKISPNGNIYQMASDRNHFWIVRYGKELFK